MRSLRITRSLGVLLVASGIASAAVADDSSAGVTDVGVPALTVAAATTAPAASAPQGVYAVRCWQHGVLILDERTTAPVAEPKGYSVKFQTGTGQHTTAYLTDTINATCLVKPAGPAPVTSTSMIEKPARSR